MRRKTRKRKSNQQRTKLGLPDLEHVKSAVLVSLRSPESQRSYRRSIEDFVRWYCSERNSQIGISFFKPGCSFSSFSLTSSHPKANRLVYARMFSGALDIDRKL